MSLRGSSNGFRKESTSIEILLVEHPSRPCRQIDEAPEEAWDDAISVTRVGAARAALDFLQRSHPDLILLDLVLPDSRGLGTFTLIHSRARDIPIVVLSEFDDPHAAIQAIRAGAQDFVVSSEISAAQFVRTSRFAVERGIKRGELIRLSHTEDLTGLYNRRGFLTHAQQYLLLARRDGRNLLLIMADLDGLKQVNDGFGHAEGDRALRAMARILRQTFRSSDIVGRIGGDEFAVLAVSNEPDPPARILENIQVSIQDFNNANDGAWNLSCSIGFARIDVASHLTMEEWLSRADQSLYRRKRERKVERTEPATE